MNWIGLFTGIGIFLMGGIISRLIGRSHEPLPDRYGMSEQMKQDLDCMYLIHKLREQEGNYVTIHSDNVDFNELPNCCVSISAWWPIMRYGKRTTSWEERAFRGETLAQCLQAADLELFLGIGKP